MASKSIEDRKAKVFARTSTTELVKALRTLDAGPKNPETNWARTATIEELERRYPAASAAVEAAFDQVTDEDPHVDYVAVLLAAICEVGNV